MGIDRSEIGRAAPTRGANGVTLQDAQRVVDGAVQWAEAHGLVLAVGVVDIGGHPVAMARMDGASILAGEIVIQKARLAAWLGRPTASAVDLGRDWPHVYSSFVSAAQGSIVMSKGGIPLARDGQLVGAVGASGGSADQDLACSQAGAAAAGFDA
jgi:uncharacterized protein GlcG (DUF336 family)